MPNCTQPRRIDFGDVFEDVRRAPSVVEHFAHPKHARLTLGKQPRSLRNRRRVDPKVVFRTNHDETASRKFRREMLHLGTCDSRDFVDRMLGRLMERNDTGQRIRLSVARRFQKPRLECLARFVFVANALPDKSPKFLRLKDFAITLHRALDDFHPSDPKRPDLEESTNVAEAHAAILETASAASREKRLEENGLEPVSLWIFLASAVVLLVGGAVMGAGGNLFDYNPKYKDYVRAEYKGAGESGPVTDTLMNAMMRRGAKVYSKCAGCHQASGSGAPGVAPPLAGADWVTGNTEKLAMIILNGLQGPIDVNGQTWTLNMPAQMPIDKVELAAVMTYIRNSFGNETGDVVTPEQAAAAIELSKERAGGAPLGPQTTAAELKEKHDRMLPGDPLDPNTIVDVETLEPAGDAAGAE